MQTSLIQEVFLFCSMDKQRILEQTRAYVKQTLENAEGGHDWSHIVGVCNTARQIASNEGADLFLVELGALLHDIADSKFHDGDESLGPERAACFLKELGAPPEVIWNIEQIIRNVSFKNSLDPASQQVFNSPELKVIQDADRLDAMGAIGIARAFNYGGFRNRELYNPDIPPEMHQSKESYKKSTSPTINHFYEKLLLLKDGMHTETGKAMAEKRHAFMEAYLQRFYDEWEGLY